MEQTLDLDVHVVERDVSSDPAGERSTDRAPTDRVDRHAGFDQRAVDAEVSEPARPATAQHQPDAVAARQASEPRDVVGVLIP